MKNKFIDWLQIRSKEERKEYIQELMRPATKEDYIYWGIFGCWTLGYSLTILNIIIIAKHFILGSHIWWSAIAVSQTIAFTLLALYRYLTRPK